MVMFWTNVIYLPHVVNKCAAQCAAQTRERLQGRLILDFLSLILTVRLFVILRWFWAGLHLQKALRWKRPLTCTQGRRLWYRCCWASIWTPEASCPPQGRSWPDDSLPGGSLEVPAPFWSRGPHHLRTNMKEAQLEKVRSSLYCYPDTSAGTKSCIIKDQVNIQCHHCWFLNLHQLTLLEIQTEMAISHCEQTNRSHGAKVITTGFLQRHLLWVLTAPENQRQPAPNPLNLPSADFATLHKRKASSFDFFKKRTT